MKKMLDSVIGFKIFLLVNYPVNLIGKSFLLAASTLGLAFCIFERPVAREKGKMKLLATPELNENSLPSLNLPGLPPKLPLLEQSNLSTSALDLMDEINGRPVTESLNLTMTSEPQEPIQTNLNPEILKDQLETLKTPLLAT